jgi:predicted Zn-dependent protease
MFEQFFGAKPEDDKALARIPVSLEEERKMGQQVGRSYFDGLKRQGIRVASRGKEVQYLRELVEKVHLLLSQRKRYRTIDVFVVESPECEAKSLPGGTLVFYRGLLDAAQNEAALVAVVGHELAHLDRGHLLRRARQFKSLQQTLSSRGGSGPEKFAAAMGSMSQVFLRPFRPEDEAEADGDAVRWTYRAGYDPRELARLLDGMAERQGQTPLPGFLQSHPDPRKRAREVRELCAELQKTDPKEGLMLGEESFRRRVARKQEKE